MRKITKIALLLVAIGFVLGACSKSGMSYSDYVKRENRRIDDFRAERNIVVLNDYPSNGVFKSNEFYLDPSGVYINVVDSGNGTRAKQGAQVYYRFSGASTLPVVDSTMVNLSTFTTQPLGFSYGVLGTYSQSNYNDYPSYMYLSPGVAVPLQYVGEGAVVRLIIPFINKMGSAYQNTSGVYQTMYFDDLTYTAIIN